MKLAKYLANLGYGSRKEVQRMIEVGRVTHREGRRLREGDACAHEEIRVDGASLDPPAGSVILLHKPVGYVCSTSDVPPLVYELFPERFRRRTPVLATVGRLDRDTSGLLLLTDDGALNHRLTSPRSHVPKCYEVELAEPLSAATAGLFAGGTLMLAGETTPLRPATLVALDDRRAQVTVHEGRYHQVRRMFAATGNHVVSLRRVAMGGLTLDGVAAGQWRLLDAHETQLLSARDA